MFKDQFLVMRDLVDQQLETSDQREIGRVADVQAEWRADGSLVLTHLVTGPQALAGRVASRLRPVVRLMLRDRFEHAIALDEIEAADLTLRLRGTAAEYPVGQSERWIVDHILRFIPGSGR